MAILNNQVITLDAILTEKGRQLLANNDGSFKITQFALADDEIDYTLYNPTHPSGSAFYGQAIEYTPIMEAFPDDTQTMLYKLITLPRGTSALPIISLGGATTITLAQGASTTITPQTLNYLGNTSTYEPSGYSMTIADSRLLSSFKASGINNVTNTANLLTNINGSLSNTIIGTNFSIVGTSLNTLFTSNNINKLVSTITVIGLDSGARITIPINITKITN